MTPFEFLLALYVILAGLGLTLLVRSIGQIIEAREYVSLYWIHTLWIAFIFLFHVTNWFAFWEFRAVQVWSIGRFLLLLSLPTLLYLVSHIAVPEVLSNGTRYDMRDYFYKRHRILMGLLALTMVLNIVNDVFLRGQLEYSSVNIVRALVLALVGIGALSHRPWVQGTVAIVLVAISTTSVALLDDLLT